MTEAIFLSEEISLIGRCSSDEIIKFHLPNFHSKNWSKNGKLKKTNKVEERRKSSFSVGRFWTFMQLYPMIWGAVW